MASISKVVAGAAAVAVLGGIVATGAQPASALNVPSAPSTPIVYARHGGAVLQWNAPGNLGSPPLTSYRVEVNDGSGWSPAQVSRGAIALADSHACALIPEGEVKCWGHNGRGALGAEDVLDRGDEPGEMGDDLPSLQFGPNGTPVALDAGVDHTCAVFPGGGLKCWGGNGSGQLGLGDVGDRGDEPGEMDDNLPDVELGAGRSVVSVAAAGSKTCALLDDGTVKCWGDGSGVGLGYGDTQGRGDAPGEMGNALESIDLGTGRTAVSLDGGDRWACAQLDDGALKCWGDNTRGHLGLGDTEHRGNEPGEMGDDLPAVDLGSGRTVVSFSTGQEQTCAVLDTGAVKCWGAGSNLGLGDSEHRGDNPGEMGDALPSVDLGTGRTALAVASASEHTCALLDNGSVKCWGGNDYGQLGLADGQARGDDPGEMGDDLPVVQLGTGRTVVAIAAGGQHTCAVFDDATTKCWGDNTSGMLGIGATDNRGDEPGEMGDALPVVDLGTNRTVVPQRNAMIPLDPGTYQFRIVASNAVGDSAPGGAAAPIVVPNASVPDAPTSVDGIPGDSQVELSWTAPVDDGGAPITDYLVVALHLYGEEPLSAAEARLIGSATTNYTFTGLENDNEYVFRVAAVNSVRGHSRLSAASPLLQPEAPPVPAVTMPGPVTVDFDGEFHVNSPPDPGTSELVWPNITGTAVGEIDADGDIVFPKDQITFDPQANAPLSTQTSLWNASVNWTGHLDETAGTLTLVAGIASRVVFSSGGECRSAFSGFLLTTGASGTHSGQPYDSISGEATIVDNTFPVGDPTNEPDCPAGGIGPAFGLPADPGESYWTLDVRLSSPPPETVSEPTAAGGTVSTDGEADGATVDDPVETTITTPNAGTVSIVESTAPGTAPTGYAFVGFESEITAPPATVAAPLVLTFRVDASRIPAGETETTLGVLRNGELVGPCTGAPGTAVPSPCVSNRALLGDGDVAITVLTTDASSWAIAAPTAVPPLCTIVGTAGKDTITGTVGNDVICALGGNDTIRGLGGNDTIYGDAGNDTIFGGTGSDVLAGNDKLRGEAGDDELSGDDGNDSMFGGDGDDRLYGRVGKDVLKGDDGNDELFAGGGGNDRLTGGDGDDHLRGHIGADALTGGNGNDVMEGEEGNDRLSGGAGNDAAVGGSGLDRCTGGSGTDSGQACEISSSIP